VATKGDRLWLLIDRPHFVEVIPECEGDLAGSARQVEQAPATLDAASAEEVRREGGGIRKAEAIIVRRRAPIEIAAKLDRLVTLHSGYSIGCRPMTCGSRPASSQPAAAAASGMATRMRSRLDTGTLPSAETPPLREFVRIQPMTPT
jgi:hypothetical protein